MALGAGIANAAQFHDLLEKTHDGPGQGADGASVIRPDKSPGNPGGVMVGGYVDGGLSGDDMSIAKYDKDGNELWRVRYDAGANTAERLTDLTVYNDGAALACGYTTAVNGKTDLLVVRYSFDGQYQWAYSYDGDAHQDDVANAITTDDYGWLYVTGSVRIGSPLAYKDQDVATIKLNILDGAFGWAKVYDYDTIDQDDQGLKIQVAKGIVNVAGTSVASGEREDVLALRYQANTGTPLSAYRYAGVGHAEERVLDLAVDADSNMYICGSTAIEDFGTTDLMVLQFTENGFGWAKTYDGPGGGSDIANAIDFNNGNITVAGSMYAGEETGDDVSIMRFYPDGSRAWERSYAAPGLVAENVVDIARNGFGEVAVLTQAIQDGDFNVETLLYSFNGDLIGNRVYDSGKKDFAGSIWLSTNGNAYLAGTKWTGDTGETANQHLLAYWKGILFVDIPGGVTEFIGGKPITGRIELGNAAKTDLKINLTDSSQACSVPAEVTVPQGQQSMQFQITTQGVAIDENVTITAQINDGVFDPKTTTFKLKASTIQALGLVFADVYGGGSGTAQVDLTGPAPAAGYTVQLSDNTTAIDTPPTLEFYGGLAGRRFIFPVHHVTASATRMMSATLNGITKNAVIRIHPGLKEVKIDPNSITGGSTVTGTVTLMGPAKPGGSTMELRSNSSAITVPQYFTVPAGATTATFAVTTSQVSADATRMVTADLGGLEKNVLVTLTAGPRLSTLTVSPSTIVGGQTTTGTIGLTGTAPTGGRNVEISDNTAAITTPSSVLVQAGSSTGTFQITTTAVSATATRQVTATMGGVTRSASVTLQAGTALSALSLNATAVKGGNPVQATVTLVNPAPAGGKTVTLSDNSGSIGVPATVVVPAGSKSATFTVTTSAVTQTATRQVYAAMDGVTKTVNLTLMP